MRIISGKHRGRKIKAVQGNDTRPTSDRVKESLFNMLYSLIDINNKAVLDLFSGTGNLSIEALSRGAKSAVLVDNSRKAIDVIRENINLLNLNDCTEIIKIDALSYICRTAEKYDIIFLDPPYALKCEVGCVQDILANKILNDDGHIIIEHATENILPEEIEYDKLKVSLVKYKKYGQTAISIYK